VPCVLVDHRLRQLEPLAWKFACDFAESNRLKTTDVSQDESAQDATGDGAASAPTP
jgi:hypothetical protein